MAACQPSEEEKLAEAQQVIAIATQQARATAQAEENATSNSDSGSDEVHNVNWNAYGIYHVLLTGNAYYVAQDQVFTDCAKTPNGETTVKNVVIQVEVVRNGERVVEDQTFNVTFNCKAFRNWVQENNVEAPAELARPTETSSTSVETEWFSGNVAESGIITIKENTTGGCNMPQVLCYFFDNEGVLGADDYDEAEANPSAVWTGSGVFHQSPDGPEYDFLIAEGSYGTTYAKQFGTVVIGEYTLHIPSCGQHCAQGLVIRGWFHKDGVDGNLSVHVENYGANGAASWTNYAVPYQAAQFFSQDYARAQWQNSFEFMNNGVGPNDSFTFIQHVFDINDGSYTVLGIEADGTETVLWTNISGHGR